MLKICKKWVPENEECKKYSDLKDFLKAQYVIFRCQKYVNEKNNLPWAFKYCV